jgi:hypothetical protein
LVLILGLNKDALLTFGESERQKPCWTAWNMLRDFLCPSS